MQHNNPVGKASQDALSRSEEYQPRALFPDPPITAMLCYAFKCYIHAFNSVKTFLVGARAYPPVPIAQAGGKLRGLGTK
jgi:hypothetical protein